VKPAEYKSFTWKDLKKILDTAPEDMLKQPVLVVDCGGADVFPNEMRYNKRTQDYYLKEE
jgi:hypothetical protein